MGFMGNLMGMDSNGGSNFTAAGTDILQPADLNQNSAAYGRSQNALDQQANFLNTLQGRSGLENQEDVYRRLTGVANGTGPNPALAQFNQATTANVANQAALMASQRGANANVGLLARQASMQGGNIQQQAAQQAATMQAQQQLGAIGQMQGLAGTQVNQQLAGQNAYNQNAQGMQGHLLNAINAYNQNKVAMQSNMNNADAGIQGQVAKGQSGMLGGALGAAGAAAMMLAKGGMVPKRYADGGEVGPASAVGQIMSGFSKGYDAMQSDDPMSSMMQATLSNGKKPDPQNTGDQSSIPLPSVPALSLMPQTPAYSFLQNSGMPTQPAALSMPQTMSPFARGGAVDPQGKVPGKAAVKGDNLKNDQVPAMLSPGEVVIPRSIMQGKNAPEKAKQFVAAILAKNGMGK